MLERIQQIQAMKPDPIKGGNYDQAGVKYKYPSLIDCLNSIRDKMAERGLSWICSVKSNETRVVKYRTSKGESQGMFTIVECDNIISCESGNEHGSIIITSVGHGMSRGTDGKSMPSAITGARKNFVMCLYNTYGRNNLDPEDDGQILDVTI